MTGLIRTHSLAAICPSKSGATLVEGKDQRSRSITPARRDGDEELWSKLEDKLSERAVHPENGGKHDAARAKGWFQNLFQGMWLRG